MKNKSNNQNHLILQLVICFFSQLCDILAFPIRRLQKTSTARVKIIPSIFFIGKNRFILLGLRLWQ